MASIRLALLALAFVASAPAPAAACRCIAPGPPCDAVWQANALFVGRVISIEPSPAADSQLGNRVELQVVEAFRGVTTATVMVGSGPGDCAFPFVVGESYLVYAHQPGQGTLTTGLCTRTRRMADAGDDLAYARSLSTIGPATLGTIRGRVLLPVRSQKGGNQQTPMPALTVTARGAAIALSATANERGEYTLTGLPIGRYELIADPPAGYQATAHVVDLRDPRGCGSTDLFVRYDGRVTGRVVDSRSAAVPGLPIELVPLAEAGENGSSVDLAAWTTADGSFEIRLVPPGHYVLGFGVRRGIDGRLQYPRALYPGVTDISRATTMSVGPGERVTARDFVVPADIRFVTVRGIVVDEAGQPVGNAEIVLRDDSEGPNLIGPRYVTAADGRFAFAAIEGARYDVHVTRYAGEDARNRRMQIGIVPFRAAANAPALTVVLKPR